MWQSLKGIFFDKTISYVYLLENDDVFNKERINDTAKNVMQSFNINSIKTPKSVRRNRSWTSVKEKKHSSSQSKQRFLSVPSAPQLASFEKRWLFTIKYNFYLILLLLIKISVISKNFSNSFLCDPKTSYGKATLDQK